LDDVRSATALFTAGWRSPANGRLDFDDDDEADCFNDVGCFDGTLDLNDDEADVGCFDGTLDFDDDEADVGCFDANFTIDVSDASPNWRSPANGRLDFDDDDEADCFNDVGCFDGTLDLNDDEADVGCFDGITCDDGFNDDDLDFFLLCFKEYKHCEKFVRNTE
jgi:hypothetical protein